MLKQFFQVIAEELANAEREFFVTSRKPLKESGWFYAPAVTLQYLMTGVKYVFLNFLLLFIELVVLIFLSPEEGHKIITEKQKLWPPDSNNGINNYGHPTAIVGWTKEEYEVRHKKARRWTAWTFSTAVAAVAIVSLVLNLSLPLAPESLGATNIFSQTNWGGGSSSNNAIHPTNQSGWNQYSSASSEVTAVNGGEDLELMANNASSTQTTDTQFNAGATSTTEVIGTGASASVKLSKALHINEYTIGVLTPISVTASTVTANSNGTWTIAFSGIPTLARIFKNDKFTDSASKAWKVLSVAPSVYKIIVVDSEGNTPAVSAPATGSGTVGRWYASLSAWEGARQGDITVTGRNAIERGLPYYDGSPDTTQFYTTGWTTDATHYIEVYVPLSERHRGKWDNTKYSIQVADSNGVRIGEGHVRIDGLQIYMTSGTITATRSGIYINTGSTISDIRMSNTIVRGTQNQSLNWLLGLYLDASSAQDGYLRLWNNIFYDFYGVSTSGAIYLTDDTFTTYLYNNTAYNSYYGYDRTGGTVIAKNNISYNNTDNYFGTFSAASTNNLSGNNQLDAPGLNPVNLTTTTVPFVDTTSSNFHLEFRDGTGNPAMNAGADLSADANLAFATDIDGDTRSGTWDIGADDAGATLAMTHSIGTASRDFSTLQAWEDARDGNLTTRKVFKISGQSAAFMADETITGLTSNATGTYVIERTTPSASETYMSLDGGSGTFQQGEVVRGGISNATATLSTILTTAGTIEKGEAYKDSTFTAGVTIDGSTTDANHYIWLTAEPGSRHSGVAGTGARISDNLSNPIIDVRNSYAIIENLEIVAANTAGSQTAINLFSAGGIGGNNATIRNNLLHKDVAGGTGNRGISSQMSQPEYIYNNIIYGFNEYGINDISITGTSWNTYNNVIYNNGTGVNAHATAALAIFRNNIVAGNTTAQFTGSYNTVSSSNNISSDASAPGVIPLTNKTISDIKFVSTASDFIDLHIMDGSVAKDAGADLSTTFKNDLDGQIRSTPFDVGADEWLSSSLMFNPSGDFVSATLDLGSAADLSTLSWTATIPSQAGGTEIPATNSGLVGLWHFNEGAGQSAADTIGGDNTTSDNGTLGPTIGVEASDPTWTTSGKYGNALSFDGGDYVSIPDSASLSGGAGKSITITAWIKLNTGASHGGIVTKYLNSSYKDYGVKYSSVNSRVYFYLENGSSNTFSVNSPNGSILTGRWYFIAATFDNSTKTGKVYIDGNLSTTGTSLYNMPDTTAALEIGRDGYENNFFNGVIDEVAVYNRALSAAEINAHYASLKFQLAANNDNLTWTSYLGPDGTTSTYFTTSGTAIPSSLDSNRYLRYKAYFSTADTAFSPQLDDLTVNYTYYATTSPSLISSTYNTNDATNILAKIAWMATTTSGTEIRVQVRSAPNSGGVPGTWSQWCGYNACDGNDYFATSTNNVDLGASHSLKNGGNDQWLQYKAIFVSTGWQTPTLGNITLTYVVNASPELQNVTASQQTSDGKVAISYEVKDVDTATGTVTPNAITPSFSYSLDGGQNWMAITSGYLGAGALTNKTVNGSTFTQYSTTWDAKTQINGTHSTTTKIMVTATDNEGANNTASLASSVFTLDVKNPTVTVTVDGTKDGQAGAITISSSDNSSLQMLFSNRSDYAADGQNGTSGTWTATSTSLTWTFASGEPVHVYGKIKDTYQNETAVAPDAPNTPTDVTIQDTSSLALSEFREFVSWRVNAASDFWSYKVYRSTNGTSYSLASTISAAATNFYEDGLSGAWLSNGTTYSYKLTAQDSSGNISRYSSVVSDIPDGQGGTDVTPPTISGLTSSNINTTQATITWTTDELSNSTVYYSTDTSYGNSAAVASMVTAHSVILTGLTPNTVYNFRVRSTDPLGNISSYATGTPFTTAQGPVISGVTVVSVSGNSATIVWNTNANSDSWVVYSTNSDLSGSQTSGTSTLVGGLGPTYEHRVSLSSLNTNAKYYYKVRSVDGSSNAAEDNNGGAYYAFSTAQDVTAPVISSVSSVLSSQTSTVIPWLTNEPADSQVIYGLNQSSLTSQTPVNSTMTINHSMVLSDLTAGATYYYKVVSADSSGNSTQSSVYNFNTTALALENTLVVTRFVESGPPADKTPPLITEVKVDGITASEATVSWRTDEDADSFVEYGPPDIFGATRGQRESVKLHRVTLMDLKPNVRYSFKATSADASGNVSVSLAVNFQTLSPKTVAEKIGDRIEQSIQQKIEKFPIENLEDIKQLTSEIEQILAEASSKVTPPRITGAEPKVEVLSSFATISWVTDRPANSIVAYAGAGNYKPNADEPYQSTVGNPDEQVTEHEVVLSNLVPGTTYHFQVRSKGLIGGVGESADFTFKTGEEAAISGIEIKDITKDSATIFWRTNLPATTLLEYGRSVDYGSTQTDASMNTSHTILLKSLQPGTLYHFRAGGIDKNNNSFFSPDLNFVTGALPSLVNVKIDSVKEREMTVSWFTDVLSDSTVEYTNGITKKTEAISDKQLMRNHTMTVKGLDENAPYVFKVISKDEKGNEVKSSEYNLQTAKDIQPPAITNIQTQSAVSGRDKVQTIVSWTTAEPSTSRVIYQEGSAINAANEKFSPLNADLKTSHVVVFTNFKPGTVYRLRVESVDGSGNISSSKDLTILTPQKQETVIDLIIKNFRDVFRWTEKLR